MYCIKKLRSQTNSILGAAKTFNFKVFIIRWNECNTVNITRKVTKHNLINTSSFLYDPGPRFATPLKHISFPALVWGVFKGNNSLDNVVPKDTFDTEIF